jgi:hypothetical protein
VATSLGLPSSHASFIAMAAMIAERLPLDAGTAAAIRRFTKDHHEDPAAARIAARAAAAGLDPEGPEAERLFAAVGDSHDEGSADGTSEGAGAGSDGSGAAGHESAEQQLADQTGTSEQGTRDAHHPDEIERLRTLLEQAFRAALGDAGMATIEAPGDEGQGWACAPFAIPISGIAYHGFIRIWYDVMKKHAGPVIVDVRSDDGRRVFEIGRRGDTRSLRYFSDDVAENSAFSEYFDGYGHVQTANLTDGDECELDIIGAIDEDV